MHDDATPVVAAFDLDGTLTDGGSVFAWLRYICGSAATYRAAARLIIPLTVGAVRSGASADRAKQRLFRRLLAGRDVDVVLASSRTFALAHLEHEGRAHVLARLEWHRRHGHDVVIVSASPQLYVEVIAEALHADGAVGTRLAVDATGRLTGAYQGQNCRGTEKLRRLEEWVDQRDYPSAPTLYAYGNSRGDLRMLAHADVAYNVGRLGSFGALRAYQRLGANASD